MPIYEPDLSYEDMRKMERTFRCAQCGNILTTAWDAQKNSYMLRCGQVLEHKGVVPLGRDPEILEINAKLRGKELPMTTEEATKETMSKMLARVRQARFPKDLTTAEHRLIASTCIEYGLDPLFGELMIYQGRPYVTIDARRRKAQETGELDGINARPATKTERAARGVENGDYLFVAEVWKKGASHPFEGWGRVTQKEINEMIAAAKSHGMREDALPIVKDPAAQAEKRAEAQALRRAFHIPLPSFEEIVEGEFIDITPGSEVTKSKSKPLEAATGPTAPPPTGTITQPQINKIWGDAKKMGYTQEEIHIIIKEKWGVESLKDLSIAQASTLIDTIAKGEGLPETEPENPGPERPLHKNPDDAN